VSGRQNGQRVKKVWVPEIRISGVAQAATAQLVESNWNRDRPYLASLPAVSGGSVALNGPAIKRLVSR